MDGAARYGVQHNTGDVFGFHNLRLELELDMKLVSQNTFEVNLSSNKRNGFRFLYRYVCVCPCCCCRSKEILCDKTLTTDVTIVKTRVSIGNPCNVYKL